MNPLERIRLATGQDVTLATLMDRLAEVNGDSRLVEEAESGLTLSYREAAERIAGLAGGIGEKIDEGDRVVVNLPNGYEFFLACLAVNRAGGVAVPVNPQMRDEETSYVIDDSGAPLVIRDLAEVEGEAREAAVVDAGDVAGISYTPGQPG